MEWKQVRLDDDGTRTKLLKKKKKEKGSERKEKEKEREEEEEEKGTTCQEKHEGICIQFSV